MSLSLRQRLAYVLRKMHLLPLADLFWFFRLYLLSYAANTRFKERYPDVHVPPPSVLYDILGDCSLAGYYQSGLEHALEISSIIAGERPGQPLKILEWGCGPARVLQYLKSPDGSGWELWGSDYNPRTVAWCQQHLSNIHFMHNGLEPPIPVEAGFFDVVYCISVFTHLSESLHHQWVAEIFRLLKPGGLLIGTFHGGTFRDQLTLGEQRLFDSGKLVVRDNIREGKKDYTAYHSDDFIRHLLAPFNDVRRLDLVSGFRQDVWTAVKSRILSIQSG
jgi:SAM-dependent methyltransferase